MAVGNDGGTNGSRQDVGGGSIGGLQEGGVGVGSWVGNGVRGVVEVAEFGEFNDGEGGRERDRRWRWSVNGFAKTIIGTANPGRGD